MQGKATFTDVQELDLVRRYNDGESTVALGKAYNVTAATVRLALLRHGVEMRPTGKTSISPDTKKDALRLREAGLGIREIAKKLGVSTGSVNNMLKTNGVSSGGNYKGSQRALDAERIATAIQRYSLGESVHAIWLDSFQDVSITTLHNELKRHGIETRPDLAKHTLTEEQRALVIEALKNPKAVVEKVADAFSVSESTVTRILRAYREKGGIVTLPIGKQRIYSVDESAFDTLTPEVLYWIGFLFADGCVSPDKYSSVLICILADKDRDHLIKLRSTLKSTHPIRRVDQPRAMHGHFLGYGYSVRSKYLCAALTSRGFITKRTKHPTEELWQAPEFWRGMIDGDGSLGTCKNGNNIYPHISLAGQIPLLEAFQWFLRKNGLADLNHYQPDAESAPRIGTTGSTAGDIISALYKNATVSMDRKNRRAQAIISGNITLFPPYIEEPSIVKDDEIAQSLIDMNDEEKVMSILQELQPPVPSTPDTNG